MGFALEKGKDLALLVVKLHLVKFRFNGLLVRIIGVFSETAYLKARGKRQSRLVVLSDWHGVFSCVKC